MDSKRTAISRSKPSRPLKAALKLSAVQGRVLDFGCGKGADVAELERLGYKVKGYDPHFQAKLPRGRFQTVLMTYVVNVLQMTARNDAINKAWGYVKPGGRLIVTARTTREVDDAAIKGKWRPCREYGGGWITSINTYQRGFSAVHLRRVLSRLDGVKNIQAGPANAGGVMVILLKE